MTNEFNIAFRAFDIHIPELGIRDIQFLPSSGQIIRFAILYEYRGQKHLKVYQLDVSNKQVTDSSPALTSVAMPDTSSTIVPSTISSIVLP